MRDVMVACADGGLTVVIASHVISELERLCDWLLVLTGGRLQLAGAVEDLVSVHHLLTMPLPLLVDPVCVRVMLSSVLTSLVGESV